VLSLLFVGEFRSKERLMISKNVLVTLAALPLVAFSSISAAADKGVNEVAGSLAYTDIEDVSTTMLGLSYGRYLTPMHELGVSVSYEKVEMEDVGNVDGTTLGGFYHLNFDQGGDLVPFLGVSVAYIAGDLGDAYEYSYGVSAGLKVYPYEHAGIVMGVGYQNLVGAENWIDDADAVSVNVGLALRF
jgi:hypothetical protein